MNADHEDGQRPVDPRARGRNRTMLIAVAVLFFGSLLLAGVLRFSGWQPEGRKNNGELLEPPVDLREQVPVLVEGGEYDWNPGERTWRIAVAPPARCGDECARLANDLDKVWQLFGAKADRVHVLWICADEGCMPPSGAPQPATLQQVRPDARLRDALPRVDDPSGVPVYVIDPNGFVILRYAPGFDPVGLREDVARLLKLI